MPSPGGVPVILYDLAKHARVSQVVSPTQFVVADLAGYPDGYFGSSGIIVGWGIYVLRDTRSTVAVVSAPQGEQTPVLTSAVDGTITHLAFTVPMVVGDEILMMHPNVSMAWLAALATQNVPLADSLVNLELRDVIGNKTDTPDAIVGNTSSLMRYVKAILTAGGGTSRPLVDRYEGWQDELGIDPAVWTVTDPVTGAAWARGAVGENLMAAAAPNANENARLVSAQRWVAAPGLYGVNKILRKLNVEFEAHFVGSANFDNANFFLGLTPAAASTRATIGIMGFALVGAGNALQTLTDAGGAETVNTGFGENLLLTNKFKIVISLNSAAFYFNETLIATHIVNLPDAPFYLNFYAPTGAGGAATIRIGVVRIWTEDLP